MAQIRSKQIADFLSTVNWSSVANTQIPNTADIKTYVDGEVSALGSNANASIDSLEDALSAEIVATNGDVEALGDDVTSIDTRAGQIEANLSAEIVETTSDVTSIDLRVSVEEDRVDAILLAADADKDSFVEIVSLINAVDTDNDDALANVISDLNAEISATNTDITSINARAAGIEGDLTDEAGFRADADASLEAALSAEISATNTDVDGINNSVDSLEDALSAEISATNSDVSRIDGNVGSVETRLSEEEDARLAGDEELQASVDSIEAQLEGTSGDLDASVDSLEFALSAEIVATNGDVDSLEAALSAEIVATNGDVDGINNSVDSLEDALSAEISATNSDVSRIDGNVGSVETRLSVEEDRVDAILLAADADKDSFVEIVSLINSVDSDNDEVFAGYVTSNNASVDSLEVALSNEIESTGGEVNALQASVDSIESQLEGTSGDLDASVDSLEVALSAEIVATNGDIDGINDSVDSLEAALSTEISTEEAIRETKDSSLEDRISDVEANISDSFVSEDDFATETFTGNGYVYTLSGTPANDFGAFDVFVNGLKVNASFATGDITISASYTIDATDSVVVKYVQE